jgi:hypothetical protein
VPFAANRSATSSTALVEVIAVGRLQRLDRVGVLEPLDALAVGGEARFGRLLGERGERDERDGQRERISWRISCLPHRPAGHRVGRLERRDCGSGNGAGALLGGRSGGKSFDAWLCTTPSPGASRAQPRS